MSIIPVANRYRRGSSFILYLPVRYNRYFITSNTQIEMPQKFVMSSFSGIGVLLWKMELPCTYTISVGTAQIMHFFDPCDLEKFKFNLNFHFKSAPINIPKPYI